MREIPTLAERAANLFQSNGSAESAASTLDKAAKIIEQQYPEQALCLYQRAAEIAMVWSKLCIKGIPNFFFF